MCWVFLIEPIIISFNFHTNEDSYMAKHVGWNIVLISRTLDTPNTYNNGFTLIKHFSGEYYTGKLLFY